MLRALIPLAFATSLSAATIWLTAFAPVGSRSPISVGHWSNMGSPPVSVLAISIL